VHTEDHPLEYLDFHGVIPEGNYGAGSMTIWDRGTYDVLKWEDRKIEVHLHGERVDARYALFPLDKEADPKNWMVHLMGDALDPDAEPMPDPVPPPMLARTGELPPDDDEHWAYEIKWDGIRAILRSEPGTLRLFTRNLNEVTGAYPELRPFNRALSHHRAILDGEIVALGEDGTPSFSLLQRRMHVTSESAARRLARDVPVTLVLFDVLWLDGHPVTSRSYDERRALLRELVADGDRWTVPDHVVGRGSEVLAAARAQGLEGVVAKRRDCPYEPGRRANGWRKVKVVQRQEVVVVGWLPGEGRRRSASARSSSRSARRGRCATPGGSAPGSPRPSSTAWRRSSGRSRRTARPSRSRRPAPGAARRGLDHARWLAEVEFTEWTPDGQLRHPSYKGLRDDKPAWEVVREARRPPRSSSTASPCA
jgi:bifunctional non-homologous end joining protein LigD